MINDDEFHQHLICTIFSRSSESDIAEFMLLEVPHERVTIMEELGRGAFGRVYKSVMRGVPETITSYKPNWITVWIRMRDALLLQKFYQVRVFRIWQKDNLLFQQTLFTGVIRISNR